MASFRLVMRDVDDVMPGSRWMRFVLHLVAEPRSRHERFEIRSRSGRTRARASATRCLPT
jgi:hypothetical protein